MPPKGETYTFNQVKEIIEKNEETMMKFFQMTVDRLEKRIDNLQNENANLKRNMDDINKAMNFQNEVFEDTLKKVKEQSEKK